MELLFSYGTLQIAEVQLRLFGRQLDGTKDLLKGYKVATIEITDEVFLAKGDGKYQRIAVKKEGDENTIEGTVLELSMAEILHADKYEPADYRRIKVKLASGREAWIYAAAQP